MHGVEKVALRFSFDTFGDDFESQAVGQADGSGADGDGVVVFLDLADKRAVNF
jgi:hypothetical protein